MLRVLRHGHLCLALASHRKGAHRVLSFLSKNYWHVWRSLNNDCSCVLRNNVLNAHVRKVVDRSHVSFCLPNNKKHRIHKPAVIWFGEQKQWWINGKLHRDGDNLAVIYHNGSKEWFVNGKWHRGNDKPAVIWWLGSKQWWSKQWWVNGNLHRDNGKPAIIYPSGEKEWWVNDKRIK